MRKRFQPEPPDPAKFVESATVVPDSSVLLGLYRLSPKARSDALAALEAVSDRLWLPHQAGLEFYRNLEDVRRGLDEAYSRVRQAVADLRKMPSTAFGEGRRHEDSREAIKASIDTAVGALLEEIGRLCRDDPAIVDPECDEVLSRIEGLFEDRVGAEPPYEVVQSRVEHFVAYRAPNLIPPGYDDARRKGQSMRAAGDYLLWCELLDRAEEVGGPVLLVTDDLKSDWYQRAEGKVLGPRQELVAEFARRSIGGYHQMTLARFVDMAKETLGAEVAEESVGEIEEAETASVRETERAELERRARSAAILRRLIAQTQGASALDYFFAQSKETPSLMLDRLIAQSRGASALDYILAQSRGASALDYLLAQSKETPSLMLDRLIAQSQRADDLGAPEAPAGTDLDPDPGPAAAPWEVEGATRAEEDNQEAEPLAAEGPAPADADDTMS